MGIAWSVPDLFGGRVGENHRCGIAAPLKNCMSRSDGLQRPSVVRFSGLHADDHIRARVQKDRDTFHIVRISRDDA